MALNKFQFIGNLTRDAEVRTVGQGKLLGFFTIGVNQFFRDSTTGESKETADFIRIKCWDRKAENAAQYLGKGSKVYVEGRVQTSSYEKDGKTEYVTDFVADVIDYLQTTPPAAEQPAQD